MALFGRYRDEFPTWPTGSIACSTGNCRTAGMPTCPSSPPMPRGSPRETRRERCVGVGEDGPTGTLGWERYVGLGGAVIGMKTFGASAPLKALITKFGFTPEAVTSVARGAARPSSMTTLAGQLQQPVSGGGREDVFLAFEQP
jgi:hypothetical protein